MKITGISYTLMGFSLFMLLLTGCTGEPKSEGMSSTKPKTLAAATELIDSECPRWVDPESRLDSVRLLKEEQICYYYTLPNKDGHDINSVAFNAFLLPKIIENILSNPDLRMHRDSSLTFVFNYRGRGGVLISELVLGPESYR